MTAQIVDDPADLVAEALEGFAVEHADLVELHRQPLHLTRRGDSHRGVALVSGGGSGHEPLHIGFVGPGMLHAAVPGQVFASPNAAQIAAAIRSVAGADGVLLVVKNYTGDVINFSLAADLAREEGVLVETVVVDDDLATDAADGPGRRGTAATLLVEKLCGAAAAEGRTLAEVAALGRETAAASRSLAAAFRSATLPGRAEPSFELPPGTVEFGVGIHGERGTAQLAAESGSALVASLLEPLVADLDLARGDGVLLIVNGLGGMPGLGLAAARHFAGAWLGDRGIDVTRSLTGSFVTALDMQGLSLTLLPSTRERLRLWDAPVRTAAWTW